MKKNLSIFWSLVVSFALAACAAQPLASVNAPDAPTETILDTATAIPPEASATPEAALDEAAIRNLTLTTPTYQKTVTLVDSQYEEGEGEQYFRVNILSPVVFGDLNQDGAEDAGILVGETAGGSGFFVSLVVVFNQNGAPVQGPAVSIDDRPAIHNLAFKDGSLILDATLHDFDDPMTSPTFLVTETFVVTGGELMLVQLASKTITGEDRMIKITSPADGDQVTAPVQIKGEMPIGPFESTLLYTIYDSSGSEIERSSFMVQSNGIGGPATFDQALESFAFTPGTTLWIELSERSMADGSALALTRIRVTIK